MATANPTDRAVRPRRWRSGLALTVVLLALAAVLARGSLHARAMAGTSFGARIGCSCRYVEGRTMDSCKGDTEPGMEIVSVSDDPTDQAVTGSVPLLANRTARYKKGFGCLLDPER